MVRIGWWRGAALGAPLAALLWAAEAAPQKPRLPDPTREPAADPPPARAPAAQKFVPRFEAVAETRLLMEGLAHANYQGIERLLRQKPADDETWMFARGQALLIAETGNLLLLRPP